MRRIFIALALIGLLVPAASLGAQNGDEREVVVAGIGLSEEEAKKQAYRNAIQSVIGSLVVAETLIKNEEVISDKILSHSDGYITKVQPLGPPKIQSGGLVSVTMKVTVKSERLREKLRAENISTAEMDGESIFTKKTTKKESRQDAAAIVREALKALPASVVKAEAYVPEARVEDSGGLCQ